MADEKEKTIETSERDRQLDPQSLEPEEELSELDVEEIAGASCCFTRVPAPQ